MSHNLDEGIAFVRALGVEVRHVEPDGTCATYDRFNRIAYVCRDMCKDRAQVMENLLARVT